MDPRAARRRAADQSDRPDSGGPLVPSLKTRRLEQSIDIETTPEKVFQVLIDPNNISRYAGGIEGAEVLEQPNEDFAGAILELVTKRGNIRRAEVLRADPTCIEVLDERGLRGTWEIEDLGNGCVRIRNIIEGPLTLNSLNQLQYDADVKFQALQHILEERDPISGAG